MHVLQKAVALYPINLIFTYWVSKSSLKIRVSERYLAEIITHLKLFPILCYWVILLTSFRGKHVLQWQLVSYFMKFTYILGKEFCLYVCFVSHSCIHWFFFYQRFLSQTPIFTGQQRKGEAISLIPLYNF